MLAYPDGTLQIKSDASGKCMDISHSDQNPGSGSVMWPCATYQASQLFKAIYQGNSQFELQSVLLPQQCLNVSGGQSNPNTAATAILFPCDNTAKNERFFFGPANLSHATSPLNPRTRIPKRSYLAEHVQRRRLGRRERRHRQTTPRSTRGSATVTPTRAGMRSGSRTAASASATSAAADAWTSTTAPPPPWGATRSSSTAPARPARHSSRSR